MSLTILAFLTGSFAAMGAASLLLRSPVARRLTRATEGAGQGVAARAQLVGVLARIAARTSGASDETRERLVQAGFRGEDALSTFRGGRVVLPVVLVLLVLVLSNLLGIAPGTRSLLLLVAGGAGYLGPSFVLDKLRARRQLAIRMALPDALDLLIVCIEAGLSMGAAFQRVAREFVRSAPALCEEMRLVNSEMQAGKSGAEAIRGLADRVGVDEVNALAAMLIQSERFGTSVADALRVHTDGMRKDRLQKAEERAQKAAVRMLIPAGMLIFPATMIVILGPAAMVFQQTFAN